MSDFVESEAEESEEEYNDEGEVVPRVTKKFVEEEDDASFDDRLEDDDFDLIEENLGVKVKRGVSVILCLCPWDEGKRP